MIVSPSKGSIKNFSFLRDLWRPLVGTRYTTDRAGLKDGSLKYSLLENPPAGTGTVTVCLLLFWPLPRHSAHGVLMMEPLPPQRRHVLFIKKGPVLMDSCGEVDAVVKVKT